MKMEYSEISKNLQLLRSYINRSDELLEKLEEQLLKYDEPPVRPQEKSVIKEDVPTNEPIVKNKQDKFGGYKSYDDPSNFPIY